MPSLPTLTSSVANYKLGACSVTFNSIDCGLTKGGVQVDYKPTTVEKKVDKYGDTPVGVALIGQRFEIKFKMAEGDLQHIAQAIAGAAAVMGTTKFEIDVGSIAGKDLASGTMVLHPLNATDTTTDWNFVKVVQIGSPQFQFKNEDGNIYEVTYLALIDETKGATGNGILNIGTKDT